MVQEKNTHTEEIDLIEIIKSLVESKFAILKSALIFAFFGLLIAFTTPPEYTSSTTLISEVTEGNTNGSLGSLASLAGVDVSNFKTGASIDPRLYQNIAQSTPFILGLLNEKIHYNKIDKEISLKDYFLLYQSTNLLSKIKSIPFKFLSIFSSQKIKNKSLKEDADILQLSSEDQGILNNIKSRILVTLDLDLNTMSIKVQMQDAYMSAKVAVYTRDYIKNYIKNYTLKKSREQLEFVQKQYVESKIEFEKAQLNLAKYRDENQFVQSAKVKSEEEMLLYKYNLAYNIFNNIAQKKEQIKLKVSESTPVYTVLEPVILPLHKSNPRKIYILVVSIMAGCILGVIYITLKQLYFQDKGTSTI